MSLYPHCTYCHSPNYQILYDTQDMYGHAFNLLGCADCEAIYLSPQPTEAQLAQAYDEDYYGQEEEKFDGWIERVLNVFRARRAAIVKKYVKEPANVLDIGCGNGLFLSNVARQGNYNIHGIEMPGKAANRAARIPNIHLQQKTLSQGDFPKDYFGAITLFHVFEHLLNPKEVLDIIQEILHRQGILIIAIPNIDSFQSQLFKGKWLHLDPPRHTIFFKPSTFKKLMQDRGFQLLEENYYNMEYNPFGFQQSLLNKLFNKRELLYESLKGNKSYTANYSRLNLGVQKAFFVSTFPLFAALDIPVAALKKSATVTFVFRKN